MKAKEFAQLLMEHPDFDVYCLCTDKSMSRPDNNYTSFERFSVNGVADVGCDDNEILIGLKIDRE